MIVTRRRIAQAFAAIAAAGIFLPWQTTVGTNGTESVQGTSVNEGQIVFVVCLITIGLIQLSWRPAWIGVGFAGAIAIRELLNDEADPASGLWIAAAASLVAVVLLIWEMFASVSASGNDSGDSKPGGRGLSGPLGRRRR